MKLGVIYMVLDAATVEGASKTILCTTDISAAVAEAKKDRSARVVVKIIPANYTVVKICPVCGAVEGETGGETAT